MNGYVSILRIQSNVSYYCVFSFKEAYFNINKQFVFGKNFNFIPFVKDNAFLDCYRENIKNIKLEHVFKSKNKAEYFLKNYCQTYVPIGWTSKFEIFPYNSDLKWEEILELIEIEKIIT